MCKQEVKVEVIPSSGSTIVNSTNCISLSPWSPHHLFRFPGEVGWEILVKNIFCSIILLVGLNRMNYDTVKFYRAVHLQYRIHPTWISCLLPSLKHLGVLALDQSTPGSLLGGVAEGNRHLEWNQAERIEIYATLLHQGQYSNNPDNLESHLQPHLAS